MKYIKKLLSVLLCILLLLSYIQMISFSTTEVKDTQAVEGILPNAEATDGAMYHMVTGEPSAYGHCEVWWEDEKGNRVDFTSVADCDDVTAAVSGINETDGIQNFSAPTGYTIPEKYDARTYGYVTAVESQYGGTCWAHGTIGALEGSALKNGISTASALDLSEYHLDWYTYCGYYSDVNGNSKNDGLYGEDRLFEGGAYTGSVATLGGLNGAAQESRYPIGSDESPDLAWMKKSFSFNTKFDCDVMLKSMYLIDSQDMDAIKLGVMNYGALDLAFTDGNYFNYSSGSCAFYNPTTEGTGHEVTLIGWDDSYSKSNFKAGSQPEHDGAWLCKNSWGTYFGDDGYFWISYDENIDDLVVYEAADPQKYDTEYFYDGFFGMDTIASSMGGNVFKSDGNQSISAVSFAGCRDTRDYTIMIYTDLSENYDDPTDGTLAYTQTGKTPAWGYYLVDLNGAVTVDDGELFSVVIKTDDTVTVEGPSSTVGTPVTNSSAERESYYYINGAWVDSHTDGNNNVCVKAFTNNRSTGKHTVKFACGTNVFATAEVNDGADVELPNAPTGYGYVFANGFDGKNIIRDMTVETHKYPLVGTVSKACECTTEFRCVCCHNEVVNSITKHTFTDTVTPQEGHNAGYTDHLCNVCGFTCRDTYTFPEGYTTAVSDNISWGYKDGILIVAGQGKIPDYSSYKLIPWYQYADDITTLYINEGIIKTGQYSFSEMSKLKDIDFPDSLTEISGSSFLDDGSILSVDIPGNVKKIGYWAFGYCSKLSKLTLNEGTETITMAAFAYSKLTEVKIPASVTSLEGAFGGLPYINSFIVSEGSKDFAVIDDMLMSSDGTVFYAYPAAKKDIYYNMPDTVTKIGNYAFSYCLNLKYLDLSCKAETLQFMTVERCSSLKYIMLPTGLKEIENYALNDNTVNKSVFVPLGVTKISSYKSLGYLYGSTEGYVIYTDGDETAEAYTYASDAGISVITGHTEHKYSEVERVEPICSNDGYSVSACECGCFIYTVLKNTGGEHSFDNGVITPPTCTQEGYTTYTCTRCKVTRIGDYVPALGHSITTTVHPATCFSDGYTSNVCTRCGYSYTDAETPQLTHSYTGAAVSNGDGTHAFICVNGCGTKGNTQSCIFDSGVITEPTYSSEGFTTYTCQVCGYSYKDNVTAELVCTCKCHDSGIKGFFFKIQCFFWKLFGKEEKRICACGAHHW